MSSRLALTHRRALLRRWLALAVLALALVAGLARGPRRARVPLLARSAGMAGWWTVAWAEVSKSLTPPHWSYRLPFFAKVREGGSPELRGDTAEVMTAEIAAARTARLDFTSRFQS